MPKISFTKMVASGNDFVVIEASRQAPSASGQSLAKKICNRKYGVGADGLLVLEKSKVADLRMRIFNPDGSEAQMCGNGARCVALYSAREQRTENSAVGGSAFGGREQRKISIETEAGIIESEVKGENVKIKLTDPKNIRLNIPVKVNKRNLKANFIDTGVPHAVIFVEGVDKIDVVSLGRQIRYHTRFRPAGTNVDFVEMLSSNSIKVRTYERGVEDETLACGTGAVASVLLSAIRYPLSATHKVNVYTKSGEILNVYFDKINNKFKNVWLEGKAKIVHKGEYYV